MNFANNAIGKTKAYYLLSSIFRDKDMYVPTMLTALTIPNDRITARHLFYYNFLHVSFLYFGYTDLGEVIFPLFNSSNIFKGKSEARDSIVSSATRFKG